MTGQIQRQFQPPPLELIIFANRQAAELADFRLGVHRAASHIRAWWPDREPDELRGLELSRVAVTEAVKFAAFRHAAHPHYVRNFREGVVIARARLRVAPALWLEL